MKRINISIPDELEESINNFRGDLTVPKFIKQSLDFIVTLYEQGYVIYNGQLLEKTSLFTKTKNLEHDLQENKINYKKLDNDKFLA